MKRVLVLGAGGMLGHQVMAELATGFDVVGTARQPLPGLRRGDLRDVRFVTGLLDELRPDAVVNCAGVIKQRIGEVTTAEACQLNTLLPHLLGCWCQARGARLVHVSTDCVFQGDRTGPPYRESDPTDSVDLYGYSKAAGEVSRLPAALTLRTSIIGREAAGSRFGLLEWFLGLPDGGTARGFRNHHWSGVTTLELARFIRRVLTDHPGLWGLYQVASEPIDKHQLLALIAEVYRKPVQLTAVDAPEAVYRVLGGEKLRQSIGYSPPSLRRQLEELCSLARTS